MINKTQLRLVGFAFVIIGMNTSCSSQNNAAEQQIQHQIKGKASTEFLKYTSGIRSILEDSKGNTWFGSHNEGVCKFDGTNFTYFTTENGLSDNQVRTIYEDQNGIIWFECGVGLSSYNGQRITSRLQQNFDPLNPSVNVTKGSWALSETDLWFKSNETVGFNAKEGNPGVYRYDGSKLSYLKFPDQLKKESNTTCSVSTPFIKGKSGKLWLGTYGAVVGYDGAEFDIIDNRRLGLKEENGFLHVRSLFEDSKGNLWIGNNGIGVLKYDGKDFVNFTKQQKLTKEETNGNSLEKVFSIGEDKRGSIWFGTSYHSGIWQYDGEKVTNFTEKDGLESELIWTIYNSKNGEVWFGGANPSGVYRFDGKAFIRLF